MATDLALSIEATEYWWAIMSYGVRLSLLALSFATLAASNACSSDPSSDRGNGGRGGGDNGTGNTGAGAAVGAGAANGTGTAPPVIPPSMQGGDCGNGVKNGNEECDDRNSVSGDGCNAACRIEADWECPTFGQACVSQAICGDGKLASSEMCDDANTMAGDGCAADCKAVDPGWQCRVPGKRCIPLCGDSVVTAPENCDDGNAASGDGCSSTCLLEPGWSCEGTTCIKSVCGNGKTEAGESCDAGESNGLFFGDGKGCSKTCTQEPACRDEKGATIACKTPCGDGNKDPGEDCDDGNQLDNDGCSKACKVEGDQGFVCEDSVLKDTQPCTEGGGDCLVLPVIYRDFDGQNQQSGHPDFFYLSTTGNTKCVPNASGNKDTTTAAGDCWKSDSTDLCSGLVEATLGTDGKPVFSATKAGTCQCRFTDWDQTGLATAGTTCVVRDNNGGSQGERRRLESNVQVIQNAASLKEWYSDSAKSTKFTDKLELRLLSGNQYQFSSSNGRTVYDDLHDIFLSSSATGGTPPAGGVTSLSSGFFPAVLEASPRPKVCNIWPYWVADGQASCAAGSTLAVKEQWDPRGWFGGTPQTPATGGPITTGVTGMKRNFYFTSEVRYLFKFVGGETLAFYGDDDVWVFINGKLALDLGAPHERLQGSVTLSATGAAWSIASVQAGGAAKTGTVAIPGLEVGKTYEIVVFHADRHPRESNYQLTLSGFSTTKSLCKANCGDGKVAAGEECDDGAMNAEGLYGGCTPQCKFGPFCGDNEVNGGNDAEGKAVEECDLGKDNNAVYGQDGCTKACKKPRRCGDGSIDTAFGEQCDDGANNGKGQCDAMCKFIPL